MAEPAVFEICFPCHVTRTPMCKPGSTIAGAVVLKLNTPLVASHILLRFGGVERVRRTPVAATNEPTGIVDKNKKQQQAMMTQKLVMDKEIFRKELILWGKPNPSSTKIIPCENVHRFHFSFTMPYINMPTPRQTPDIEINYFLVASLFSEVFDQSKNAKVLREIYTTPIKTFQFEPVIQQSVNQLSGPTESIVPMKDLDGSNSKLKISLPHSRKGDLNLHVFHPTPAYLPGESVDLLLLLPASSKKITNATFQLFENIRCRKSSAPIIDESDVPLLWSYSQPISPVQDLDFSKLSKSSITQDIGRLGRYIFTNYSNGNGYMWTNNNEAMVMQESSLRNDSTASSSASSSSAASIITTANGTILGGLTGKRRRKFDDSINTTLAGSVDQRSGMPLSPLDESQEPTATNTAATNTNSRPSRSDSIDTTNGEDDVDENDSEVVTNGQLNTSTSGLMIQNSQQQQQQQKTLSVRARTSSVTAQQSPQQQLFNKVYAMSPQIMSETSSRASQTINGETDDAVSDRSSISDTMSIRYTPIKTSFSSSQQQTPRGSSSSTTPVHLGALLSQGSYKFAKIKFQLPQLSDISPVSSMFLDFEYTVDISLTLGGSFGSTKRLLGKIPLRIVTVRQASKSSTVVNNNSSSNNNNNNTGTLSDSMSCLNLSINNNTDSPANTLAEFPFGNNSSSGLVDGSYPSLLSFIQNGERVPLPELESINIGAY